MFEDLAVGPQWRVTLDDVRVIAPPYGWTVPDQSIVPLGGAVNGVARVTTSDGDVVVRVHRPWMTGVRLDAVHAVQANLRKRGFPIPRVLENRSGITWTMLPWRTGQPPRLVECVEFVESDPIEISRQRSDIAIATLARLHEAMATIPPGTVIDPAYSAFADLPTALAMLDETEPDVALAANVPGYDRAVDTRERSGNVLTTMLARLTALQPGLPRQLVHGDLQFGNVLVQNTNVVAVLDFDYMAERTRVFDLAYSLYHGLTRLRDAATSGGLTGAEERMLAEQVELYDAYADCPLTGREVAALPYEMAAVGLYPVAEAGYLIQGNDAERAVAQTLRVERHLSLIESLIEESSVISDALIDRSRA